LHTNKTKNITDLNAKILFVKSVAEALRTGVSPSCVFFLLFGVGGEASGWDVIVKISFSVDD